MTPRRIPIAGLAEGERRLDGPLAHYLARVLRMHAGDPFVAFDPATGQEADALTVRADEEAVTVRLAEPRPGAARASREIAWVQALPKGDKCDAIVRDATELGATRIIIAQTKRSVVRLDGRRADERASRWMRIAREATRQCGRSDAPAIEGPVGWDDALARPGPAHARFCLWEGATDPLAPGLLEALRRSCPLAFACGPEGGLDVVEVDTARAAGWSVVSLGPRRLRTETVAAAVLGATEIWAALH